MAKGPQPGVGIGKGSGVQTLSGHLVDDSDPSNVVIVAPLAFYAVNANDTAITVSTDPAAPSFFGPLKLDFGRGVTLIDAATGAMRNDTGRYIDFLSGTVSYNPDKGGGGTVTLNIVSETAPVFIGPWAGNLESKRTIEISNSAESFGTKLSLAVGWPPGTLLRFRAWASGPLQFVVSTATALGQDFDSPSMAWDFSEK